MTERMIEIEGYPYKVTDFGSYAAAVEARDNAYEEHGDRTPIAGSIDSLVCGSWVVRMRKFPNYQNYYL